MKPNLPTNFVEDIRHEVISESSYSDEEIWTYVRNSISNVSTSLQENIIITDGDSAFEYTVSGVPSNKTEPYWDVVKWGTIYLILKHYLHKSIAEGLGASFRLGAESVDTKTLLITMRDEVKEASSKLKQKILAYNLLYRSGSSVDLYISDKTW